MKKEFWNPQLMRNEENMKTKTLIIRNLEMLEEKVYNRITMLQQKGYEVVNIQYISGKNSIFGWIHRVMIIYK